MQHIYINMFVDELKLKLNIEDLCSFSVTVLDNKYVAFEGVKNVVYSSDESVKMRVKKHLISVSGKGLKIVEIGNGNALISGEIVGVQYE